MQMCPGSDIWKDHICSCVYLVLYRACLISAQILVVLQLEIHVEKCRAKKSLA
jgi:hypothetical protein